MNKKEDKGEKEKENGYYETTLENIGKITVEDEPEHGGFNYKVNGKWYNDHGEEIVPTTINLEENEQ